MKDLENFRHILDNIADYALIRHENPAHLSLYHIKSHSDVLIDADAVIYKKLFDELQARGIRVVSSIDEVKDTSERPFYLKWDEEKKDYVKVYRGK